MSKTFKEMNPDVVRQLLEGQENVIAPAVEKEQPVIVSVSCPACGGADTRTGVNPKMPFVKGKILPNKLTTCLSCRAEFDPLTKVISKSPTVVSG